MGYSSQTRECRRRQHLRECVGGRASAGRTPALPHSAGRPVPGLVPPPRPPCARHSSSVAASTCRRPSWPWGFVCLPRGLVLRSFRGLGAADCALSVPGQIRCWDEAHPRRQVQGEPSIVANSVRYRVATSGRSVISATRASGPPVGLLALIAEVGECVGGLQPLATGVPAELPQLRGRALVAMDQVV